MEKAESIGLDNKKIVSVSSRSYILSYGLAHKHTRLSSLLFPSPLGVIFSLIKKMLRTLALNLKFPSPLGVIFSLIKKEYLLHLDNTLLFPSPLGVIFSLILLLLHL